MSAKSDTDAKPPHNGERFFAIVATVVTVFVAGVVCLLFFLLDRTEKARDEAPHYVAESPPSKMIPPDHSRQLVDFSLIDRTERRVTRSDLSGKVVVANFLLTGCTLTCPAINQQMTKIQGMTTNMPDVALVSLTVNPRDDTPEVLKHYAERFNANTNRWLFLTGEKNGLYDLLRTSFLPQDTNDDFGYMPGNFSHTDWIALLDSGGHLCGYFDGLNPNTPEAVVNEIKKIRR